MESVDCVCTKTTSKLNSKFELVHEICLDFYN